MAVAGSITPVADSGTIPDRVFSLYAGLAALNVGKSDVLSFSDVIGVTRGNLYFEIRVDNQPRDPMDWLR